jgi:DNA replication protein DnaC
MVGQFGASVRKHLREMWQAAKIDILEKCNRSDVLMIDDITNAPWTPRGMGVLRDLLDVQHECGARVIVTSNNKPQDVQAALEKVVDSGYVESMLDRLHPVTVCEMRGNSYRKELSK